jgi:RNA polymerase sigma factor (sigma-70 family)
MKIESGLIEAACQGDAKALDKLLAQSQPDLKRFARRTCATSEDAEDAVQVALWKMHEHIGALRSVSAFAGWVFRIIERECFRLFSVLKGTEPMSEQVEATMLADDRARDALRHDLVAAIAALPPTYSQILILRDIQEWTAPEAAHYLGITVEAAKTRLHRARAMMKARLTAGHYCTGDTPC